MRPAPGDRLLEGLDKIVTVNHLGLSAELRCSLRCRNVIDNMNETMRQVSANVKHSRNAAMALRWRGTAMLEFTKSLRRLEGHRQLPILKAVHAARDKIKAPFERESAAA